MPSINDYRNKFPSLRALDDDALIQRVAEVQGVDTQDVIAHMGYKPPKEGLLRQAGNLALGFGQGAVQGVRMLSDVAGADNPVSGGLRTVEEFIGGLQSAGAKRDRAEISRILQEAEGAGVLDQVVAGVKAFGVAPGQMIAQAAGTMAPTVAAAMVPGGQALLAGRLAPAAVGAAQGVGNIKGNIYEEVGRGLTEAGATPEEAARVASQAQSYTGPNTGQIALGGALGALAGGSGVERAAQSLMQGARNAAPGAARRIIGGAAAEAGPEALQGGQEKFATNTALANEGFNVDPMAGVYSSATMEGMAGGLMGGALGIAKPRTQADQGMQELQAATTPDEAVAAAMKATSVPLLPAPATRADWEVVDGQQMLTGPQAAPARQPVPLMQLANQQSQQTLMADERGNVAPLPATVRADAVSRDNMARADAEAAAAAERQRRDTLGKQTPRGEGPAERIPVGDATTVENIPTGDATDWEFLPTGQATELQAEVIEPQDLLTGDNQPYGTQSGAVIRAKREGLGIENIVKVAGGWVVRPQPTTLGPAGQQVQPTGTRGTQAGDIPSLRQRAEAMKQRAAAPAETPQAPAAPAVGTPLTLDGKPYTVASAGTGFVAIRGPEGGAQVITSRDRRWSSLQAALSPGYLGNSPDGAPVQKTPVSSTDAPAPVQKVPESMQVAPAEDAPDRQGLRAEDRSRRDLDSNAAELAGQMQNDVQEDDFDPAEVLPAMRKWAEDAKIPVDDLRQAVIKRLSSKDIDLKAPQRRKLLASLKLTEQPAQAQPGATPSEGAASAQPTPGPVAPVARPNRRTKAVEAKAKEAEAQRADYFTPGNIVKAYGGFDEVLRYDAPDADGRWNVRVRRVVKQGDEWVPAQEGGRPADPRNHSTRPDDKELKAGPVRRAPAQEQANAPEPRQAPQAARGQETAPPATAGAAGQAAADTGAASGGAMEAGRLDQGAATLKRLGFADTGPAPGEWTIPVSGLGDVIAKVVSKPGEPVRAEISADYMGRRFDTRTAEGEAAIKEAVQRARDGINEGRARLARGGLPKEGDTPALPPVQPQAQAGTAASAADEAAGVATHKDPGEPAEPTTPAVVAKAIKTAADSTERTRSQMKAEALRLIDAAAADAKGPDDADVRTYEERASAKVDKKALDRRGLTGVMREKAEEEIKRRIQEDANKAAERIGYVEIKVPGDGTFKVLNTKDRLAEFRRKVDQSPGFKDRQQPTESARTGNYEVAFGVEGGSGGKLNAFSNMLDEGDIQAALDYAEAVGIDPKTAKLTDVLRKRLDKWTRDRDMAEAVAEREAAKPAAEPEPAAAPSTPAAP